MKEGSSEDIISGRISVDDFTYPIETDVYICGSPDMTEQTIKKLQAKGYKNIYSEQF
jgi:NAD(P)H-flavin reductase